MKSREKTYQVGRSVVSHRYMRPQGDPDQVFVPLGQMTKLSGGTFGGISENVES